MPLTQRQDELLHLAGTVRLPSPSPATGDLSIVSSGPSETDPRQFILSLTHPVSTRLDIARLFRLSDVAAIRARWDGPSSPRTFKTADDVVTAAVEHLKKSGTDPTWLGDASVYLAESAPTVLHIEAALSAAESADYYPPITRVGSKPAAKGTEILRAFLRNDHTEECNFVDPGD